MSGLDARVTAWCAEHRDLLDAARDPAPIVERMSRDLAAPMDSVCVAFERWLIAETESMARAQRRGYVDGLKAEARARKTRKI